jgi:putative PIN family toxin of toxin-antitoxin system
VRIVADTNTVLSGLLWQGPPRQIINAARAGVITLHTSVVLLAEFAEIIGRGKFARRILRASVSAVALVEDYQRLATCVEPVPLAAPVSRDPDDDQVLACALGAEAQLIISGDRDLLVLGAFRGIRIVAAEGVALIDAHRTGSGS